jgi:hypothetical protein
MVAHAATGRQDQATRNASSNSPGNHGGIPSTLGGHRTGPCIDNGQVPVGYLRPQSLPNPYFFPKRHNPNRSANEKAPGIASEGFL